MGVLASEVELLAPGHEINMALHFSAWASCNRDSHFVVTVKPPINDITKEDKPPNKGHQNLM